MALASLESTASDLLAVSAVRPRCMAFVRDAESARVIRRALPEAAGELDSVVTGGVAKAIQYLRSHRSPDLLIVDISGHERPLSMVQQLSEVCEPGVQVIVIGDLEKVGLYRDLMQSGVADYVVKPLTAELIAQAVDIAQHPDCRVPVSQKVGKVIAVMGMRGGIGATTVAVQLATCLAESVGRRVALVDLDLQTGDCSLLLGIRETSALREALENPSRIDKLYVERVMVPHSDRLFVLSSAESLNDELRLPAEGVEKLVGVLQSEFHYVVVDVPRTPSAPAKRVIDMAALRFLVADETVRSAREIVRLRDVIGQSNACRNLLIVNRSGEHRPDAIAHKDFLAAVEMEASLTIPHIAKRGFLQPASGGDFRTIAKSVGTLAAEITGLPVERRKWWQAWR